jgi:hypothetical protein
VLFFGITVYPTGAGSTLRVAMLLGEIPQHRILPGLKADLIRFLVSLPLT